MANAADDETKGRAAAMATRAMALLLVLGMNIAKERSQLSDDSGPVRRPPPLIRIRSTSIGHHPHQRADRIH